MKAFIIIMPILLTSSLVANELAWVDEQVEAIKPTRIGLSKRNLSLINSPFIFLEKNQTKKDKDKDKKKTLAPLKKPTNIAKTKNKIKVLNQNRKNTHIVNKFLSLGMIMNNSVMINGKWYKLGESVSGYKISKINYSSVLLIKNNKQLLLSTKTDNKKLKFQNK